MILCDNVLYNNTTKRFYGHNKILRKFPTDPKIIITNIKIHVENESESSLECFRNNNTLNLTCGFFKRVLYYIIVAMACGFRKIISWRIFVQFWWGCGGSKNMFKLTL